MRRRSWRYDILKVKDTGDFDSQFGLEREYYLQHLDFDGWYRHFFVIREALDNSPRSILEMEPGHGIVKYCLKPIVERYQTIDINPKLTPDIITDLREFRPELKEEFDFAIATDVLEHIPFSAFQAACNNIHAYLKLGGKALITIPHRRSHFLFMTPLMKPHIFTVPTGLLSPGAFYRRFIKRRIWIDPYHCWEIGDGTVKKKDVEQLFRTAGFSIEKFKKLLYVDLWLLKKL